MITIYTLIYLVAVLIDCVNRLTPLAYQNLQLALHYSDTKWDDMGADEQRGVWFSMEMVTTLQLMISNLIRLVVFAGILYVIGTYLLPGDYTLNDVTVSALVGLVVYHITEWRRYRRIKAAYIKAQAETIEEAKHQDEDQESER